jgi:hypothetical protein
MNSHRPRRHVAILVALVAALAAISSPVRSDTNREWRFKVMLDGRPIGEHRFLLREESDRRELTSEAQFNVRILFFDAYRYEHRAHEVWQGDCLERIDARTNENGKQTVLFGARQHAGFEVIVGESKQSIDSCVKTFAYWNPEILQASRLLNPQTGEYTAVEVVPLGQEVIAGPELAARYRLLVRTSGGAPLQVDLWYSAGREWVGLESRTPDGRSVRYVKE